MPAKILPSIRVLPLTAHMQALFSRAVTLVTTQSQMFVSVGTWLDQHYSQAAMQRACEIEHRREYLRTRKVLRDESPRKWRRDALKRGCSWAEIKLARINEAWRRGQRLEGERLVGKCPAVDTVIDESNVHLVFAFEDRQYLQRVRTCVQEYRSTRVGENDHPDRMDWRLSRALDGIAHREFPGNSHDFREHARRLVGIAALLCCSDPMPELGEFGRCQFESVAAELTDAHEGFDRLLLESHHREASGPHKLAPCTLIDRHIGREEVLFHRIGGHRELYRHDLETFCSNLEIALDELDGGLRDVPATLAIVHAPTTFTTHNHTTFIEAANRSVTNNIALKQTTPVTAPHKPSALDIPTYFATDISELAGGIGGSARRKYTEQAEVKLPGLGVGSHKYTPRETMRILEKIAGECRTPRYRDAAAKSLERLRKEHA